MCEFIATLKSFDFRESGFKRKRSILSRELVHPVYTGLSFANFHVRVFTVTVVDKTGKLIVVFCTGKTTFFIKEGSI